MLRTFAGRRRYSGLSLIEIMISLVAGLIVIGSVLSFTASTLQANTQNIESTRLHQELRSAMSTIAADLRRAGWDENAVRAVDNLSGYSSEFKGIALGTSETANDCVVFGYDEAGGTAGNADTGEVKAFRRVLVNGVGVLEISRGADETPECDGDAATYTSFPPACSSDGWCAFSDPRVMDITALTFAQTLSPSTCTTAPCVWSRVISVTLTGRLVRATDTQRSIQTQVRVRADCLTSTTASTQCTTAPSI